MTDKTLVRTLTSFNHGAHFVKIHKDGYYAIDEGEADRWVDGGLAVRVDRVEPPPVRDILGQIVTWKSPKKGKKAKPADAPAEEPLDAPADASAEEPADAPAEEPADAPADSLDETAESESKGE